MGDIEHLLQQKRTLQEELRENKQKLMKLKVCANTNLLLSLLTHLAQTEEKQMNDTVKRCTGHIEDYERQIAAERKRIEERSQVKREELDRKISDAENAMSQVEAALNAVRAEKADKIREAEETEAQGKALKTQKDDAQKEVVNAEGELQQCGEAERNKLAPYGNNMAEILATIERMQWHGNKPVGPLGLYVKVKDPVWAPLMRVQLGNLMTAFAITDGRDRVQLNKLLTQYKCVFCCPCCTVHAHVLMSLQESELDHYQRGGPVRLQPWRAPSGRADRPART